MSKNCTPLQREAHFQVKMYKAHQVRTTFGSWDAEKSHAAGARSTFPSQNAKNIKVSDNFWKCGRRMSKKCPTHEIDRSIVSQLDSWIHQGFCSAMRDSQQPISPIGFLFLNFRHRLVRYYWYTTVYIFSLSTVSVSSSLGAPDAPAVPN